MRVYYLTGAAFALSNLALRRLKVARFSDLNDPFELLAVDLANKDHRRAFRVSKDQINADKGLICFSESWDNPLLWGHYADKHMGIALGFEVPQRSVPSVIYATKPLKIPVDKQSGIPKLSEALVNQLLRTKFADWKYEKERRHFVRLDPSTEESSMYFCDFSKDLQLREVILGPRCELPISRIRSLVASFTPAVELLKARIAFSSFRVVKHKIASRKRKQA